MNTLSHPLPASTQTRHFSLKKFLKVGGSDNTIVTNAVYVVAAVFIAISAVIHLHLWMNGYRRIPTIGPLFFAQVIAGFLMAAFVLVTRKVGSAGMAFGFVASTLGGFILSIQIGLFGFKDSFSAPYAHMAFIVEIVALVLLATSAALSLRQTVQD
jgi:hypothetical protein